jgi:hypothetical protein
MLQRSMAKALICLHGEASLKRTPFCEKSAYARSKMVVMLPLSAVRLHILANKK